MLVFGIRVWVEGDFDLGLELGTLGGFGVSV